jgi:hypothetical protein
VDERPRVTVSSDRKLINESRKALPMATITALSSLYMLGDVADPPTAEKMRRKVCSDGLALFDGAYDVEAMLAVARRMMYITAHPDSDDRGVTTIVELRPAANQPNAGGFSRRELLAVCARCCSAEPPATSGRSSPLFPAPDWPGSRSGCG